MTSYNNLFARMAALRHSLEVWVGLKAPPGSPTLRFKLLKHVNLLPIWYPSPVCTLQLQHIATPVALQNLVADAPAEPVLSPVASPAARVITSQCASPANAAPLIATPVRFASPVAEGTNAEIVDVNDNNVAGSEIIDKAGGADMCAGKTVGRVQRPVVLGTDTLVEGFGTRWVDNDGFGTARRSERLAIKHGTIWVKHQTFGMVRRSAKINITK